MKRIFTIVFLTYCMFASGQITLEHTFEGDIYATFDNSRFDSGNYFEKNSYSQIDIDLNTGVYKILTYSSSYSLTSEKTYLIEIPDGQKISSISKSQYLVNDDSKMEFFVRYHLIDEGYDSNEKYRLVLINEDNDLIHDFGYANRFGVNATVLHVVNNASRFIIKRTVKENDESTDYSEVYQIEGLATSSQNNETSQRTKRDGVYPNPSKSIVNLPYSLNSGISIMNILDSNGNLIEQKQIDSYFQNIRLDVSGYQSGIYFYEYNGESNKFVVQ